MRPEVFEPHEVEWTPEKVNRFWDGFTNRTEEFFSAVYGRSLVSIVASLRPERYLDIGCGTGELVMRAAQAGIRAVGIDSSPELVHQATNATTKMRNSARPEFRHAPAVAIPFEEGAFDVASLVEVVEHLDDETLAATLAESRRVLRPGGVLLVTTPNNENLQSIAVHCPDCGARFHPIQHVRSWTMNSLARALSVAGFSPRVRATRLIEEGPVLERFARDVYYRATKAKPHLVALASLPSSR